jgi:putative transposase
VDFLPDGGQRGRMTGDGRGAWRAVQYEEGYLRAYGAVSEARASIGQYFEFYNGRRPHSSLAAKTPDQTYFGQCLSLKFEGLAIAFQPQRLYA